MATPKTIEEFRALIKPGMLDSRGRFKGPDSGVNFMLEGMTPEEAYATATRKITGPNDDVGIGAGGSNESYDAIAQQMLDPNWRSGPDNGGGFLGGLGRAGQGIFDGVKTNPALMAAATAGLAQYAGVPQFQGTPTGDATRAALYSDAGYGAMATPGEMAGTAGATTASGAFPLDPITPGTVPPLSSSEIAGLGSGTTATGAPFELTPIVPGDIPPLTQEQLASIGGEAGKTSYAAAAAAARNGSTFAQLAKTYGPSVAKLAVAAVASKAANDGGASTSSPSGANVDDLVSHAFGNTKSMEADYNTLFKPWAIDQVGKATARGDAGYDTLIGLASAPNKNLASFQTYVDRVGSQGYRDQQRGQAMGEVQQQADIGLGSARRAAMARGVDPSKFALQANANSINTAAAKTKAAADAETGAWDQWGKGAQTAAGMHMADSTNRANLVTGANNLGGAGLAAGTKVAAIDSGYRGGLTSGFNNTLSTVTGANNAANNQANYDKEHGLSGIVNAGLATAATKWLTDKGSDAITNIFE